jgi:hypothetical protein
MTPLRCYENIPKEQAIGDYFRIKIFEYQHVLTSSATKITNFSNLQGIMSLLTGNVKVRVVWINQHGWTRFSGHSHNNDTASLL